MVSWQVFADAEGALLQAARARVDAGEQLMQEQRRCALALRGGEQVLAAQFEVRCGNKNFPWWPWFPPR